MREEIELLSAELTGREVVTHLGCEFERGELDGREVVLTVCGIGKVNAAMTTVALLSQGVDAVVFTGVAGGVDPSLQVGDVVVSTDLVQHDVDVTPLKYEVGLIPGESLAWTADEGLRRAAVAAASVIEGAKVVEGRVVSGDQFIADKAKVRWLRETFGAACAEMEGASVAQVCAKFGVRFVVIRSMSDTADGAADVDYPAFMPIVAKRAKAVVRAMLPTL